MSDMFTDFTQAIGKQREHSYKNSQGETVRDIFNAVAIPGDLTIGDPNSMMMACL